MKCSSCGFKNTEDNKFCIMCGHPLGDTPGQPAAGPPDLSSGVRPGGRGSEVLTASQEDLLKDLEELALDTGPAPARKSPVKTEDDIDSLLSGFDGSISDLGGKKGSPAPKPKAPVEDMSGFDSLLAKDSPAAAKPSAVDDSELEELFGAMEKPKAKPAAPEKPAAAPARKPAPVVDDSELESLLNDVGTSKSKPARGTAEPKDELDELLSDLSPKLPKRGPAPSLDDDDEPALPPPRGGSSLADIGGDDELDSLLRDISGSSPGMPAAIPNMPLSTLESPLLELPGGLDDDLPLPPPRKPKLAETPAAPGAEDDDDFFPTQKPAPKGKSAKPAPPPKVDDSLDDFLADLESAPTASGAARGGLPPDDDEDDSEELPALSAPATTFDQQEDEEDLIPASPPARVQDASDDEISGMVARIGRRPASAQEAAGPEAAAAEDDEPALRADSGRSGARGDEEETCEALLKQLSLTKNEDRRYEIVKRLGMMLEPRTVPDFLGLLADPSPEIRECAIVALGNLGDSRATGPLLKSLQVESQNIRYLCVKSLGKIGDASAAEPLVRLLDEPDEDLRYIAVEALGEIGSERAVKPLIQLSGVADHDLRYVIARSLGHIGSAEALGVLLKFLRDPNGDVRISAIQALGHLGDPGSAGALLELLDEQDGAIRLETVRALGRMRSREAVSHLLTLLTPGDDELLAEVVGALGSIGDDSVVPDVISCLRKSDAVAVQRAAIEALGTLGSKESVEPLVEALALEREELKIPIARSLGRLGSTGSLAALEGLLSDADGEVRRIAVAGIGAIQDPSALPRLERLVHDPDETVRRETAAALGSLGSDEGVPLLIQLLQDGDETVSAESMKSLEMLGTESVRALVELLHSPEEKLATRAVRVLGRIGDIRTVNPLLRLMEKAEIALREEIADALIQTDTRLWADEDLRWEMKESYGWLRLSIARSLGWSKHPRTLELLLKLVEETYTDADEERLRAAPDSLQLVIRESLSCLQRATAEMIGEMDLPDTVKVVLEHLAAGPYPQVRRWLVYGLGFLKREASATALVELIKRDDMDEETDNIAEALKRLGSKTVVEKLLGAAASTTGQARRRVVVALGTQQDARAVTRLGELLKDPDEGVRLGSVVALSKIGIREVFDVLTAATKDISEKVRKKAVEVLAKMPDERSLNVLGSALHDRATEVRVAAAKALGSLESVKTVPVLVAGLRDTSSLVRESIVSTLGKLGSKKAVEPLIQLLRDTNAQVRQASVRSLGRIGDVRAVVPLLEAMEDPDLWVKTQAFQTLRDMGEAAIPSLVEALGHANPSIQASAIRLLSRASTPPVVTQLLEAISQRARAMRANTATVLGNLKERSAVVPLIGLLSDRDFEVREKAAMALGNIGDIAAVVALRNAQKDQNRDVRVAAMGAIRQIMEVNEMA